MQDLIDRMSRCVMRHADGMRSRTPLPRVGLGVSRQHSVPVMTLYEPMLCLVLQGAKEVAIGDQLLRYDTASSFVASLELPATGRIVDASRDKPYVAVGLMLDHDALADLLADLPPAPSPAVGVGFNVAPVTVELLDAWDRLLALLDAPDDIAFLAAAREREVLYRALQGGHGPVLQQIGRADSRLSRVRRAIRWIRDHYDETLRTETLAEVAGMSVPVFHRHFKAATAMSPLRYQKILRLQAARRLLVADNSANHAAYAVGYESASQFSREYARLFGMPPIRDAERRRDGCQDAGTAAI